MAVYVSAHGMGHSVRVSAVLASLSALLPVELEVAAPLPQSVWPDSLDAVTRCWRREAVDAGVVQSDDVTVDFAATGRELERWLAELPSLLQREGERLRGRFDLVVGDVPSPAFEIAKASGIPSVAIANFSWDWIYRELGFEAAAAVAARGYEAADLLLRATPFGPMPAFRQAIDVGLIARPASAAREATRAALGASDGQSLVLIAFQPGSAPAFEFPLPQPGRLFALPTGWPPARRGDLRVLPAGMAFVDAIAAADVVVGKPGYGLISDVEAAGARFLYAPRPGFPENAVLEAHLSTRAGTLALATGDLATSRWQQALSRIEAMPPARPAGSGGAARAARAILELLPDPS